MASKKIKVESIDDDLEEIKAESARILQTDQEINDDKSETINSPCCKSESQSISLDKAYEKGFTSDNKGGRCSVCGAITMYAERTKCYKHYLESK